MKEKKDLVVLAAYFSLLFFSFSSTVTHAFRWPIKGKAGRPMKGIRPIDPNPHKNMTRTHG